MVEEGGEGGGGGGRGGGDARIISVGSNIAHYARIGWENLNDFEGFAAYGHERFWKVLYIE
jgi:hypothetical protein